ncbi:Ldh family oxidoreductase [Caenimonas sp. SL110]|uniref:Ldh family oxidoreductase n=1 Tax=Caenimonas sp. SL110 TaxID=1450524 RepID=UPI000653D171|nr:Ldh family oxidoreductase [Caenimonas sp. SL110]
MPVNLSEEALQQLVRRLLVANGVDGITADAVAGSIVAAERDGTLSHGLARLPGFVSSLESGWVTGSPEMIVTDQAPAVVRIDAANGFAQGALARGRDMGIAKARANGICAISIHDSHHFGSLWPDVEPFAVQGLVCLAFVQSRSRIVAPSASRAVLGTNPMAFALPRAGRDPVVWDQASSVLAHGDVILAAKNGHTLPPDAGVDRSGHVSRDPAAVLDGGALLPFGAHKGFLIALLVEVLAAALTGSRFGFEDESARIPGAVTSNAGQMLILIDPSRAGASDFADRIEQLMHALADAGTTRMPGDRRYINRAKAKAGGIAVGDAAMKLLQSSPH